ncbi:MAG: bifunctional diaminohydroxyphosphoribosylaminopyrimidine deaminase/5-amino-6-(5-phosphoribosylamino)uracil reductase RibD [Hyphomicrobium sp.]|jgi:diaminohydroxyphosphoribosylaminopyrimidine deaminase/5-amino-6-(5-phosphoribosylamino)uracil reductase
MSDTFDQQMMQIALRVGQRGLGNVAPNPAVGAVIADVATGEIVARGWTQPGGRPHAETEAIRRAGPRAQGLTMYVTLEPCAHFGKTPPCADAIVAAGLRRVVIGIKDPDPRTSGKGEERLKAAGIEVTAGVCAEAARWLTLGHVLRTTEQRPFVQLKMALTAEGEVPRGRDGKPQWVTGPEARARGHLLRAEADAILVGGATIRDDDPELTCRLPGLVKRSPIRIVLSNGLNIPFESRIVASARANPTWVISADTADSERRAGLERHGVRVLGVRVLADRRGSGAGLDVGDVAAKLAESGITRLLVEGGPATWRMFAASGMADEVVMFTAAGPEKAAAFAGRYLPGLKVRHVVTHFAGSDFMHVLRKA